MTTRAALVTGAGLGAGLMYVLDPERGRRRRALVRDKAVSAFARSEDALGATARDMANRLRGIVAEARNLLAPEGDVPDDVVVERVREKLGHYVAHPSSIEARAVDGRVTLEGVVLESEVDGLLRAVRRVRGVRDLDNRLEIHREPDVPGLQGGVGRTGERFELLQSRWSPTARVIVGAACAGLFTWAATRAAGRSRGGAAQPGPPVRSARAMRR